MKYKLLEILKKTLKKVNSQWGLKLANVYCLCLYPDKMDSDYIKIQSTNLIPISMKPEKSP